MSSRDGVRVTTADAYLPLGDTPSSLTIRPDTRVAEVVFDGNRAVGVRALDGTVIEAGWVILCAGTYSSPAILMRSGIGPADQLQSVGVRVLVNLRGVGENLADHPVGNGVRVLASKTAQVVRIANMRRRGLGAQPA
jgi:choline dehydrogenase